MLRRKEPNVMGMHTFDDLMRKWQREELTAEQMVGQLLQHIGVLYERLRLMERQVSNTPRVNPQSDSSLPLPKNR